MLSKSNRISNKRLIDKLYKEGKVYKNDHLTFKFLPSIEPVSKFAIVVSKKISAKAAVRNKIKRQISESIQKNLEKLSSDHVCLVIVQKADEKTPYQELESDILNFFNKLESA